MAERRVILIGKTGNGKSSTGNSILRKQAFVQRMNLCSVTQCCEVQTDTNPINKLSYAVCDTPGLLDTDVNLLDRLLEVQKAVDTCKEPHAFLLVFNSTNRFSEEDQHTVDIIRIVFGEKVFDHCVIVFTRGNAFDTNTEFESFFESSDCFVNLLEKCGGRVVRIENTNSNFGPNLQGDNRCLLDMIEKVSDEGKLVYQYSFLDSHNKVLHGYAEKNRNTKTEIDKHLANISKKLNAQLMTDHEALKADNETLEKYIETLKVDNETLKDDKVKLEVSRAVLGVVGTIGAIAGAVYVAGPVALNGPAIHSVGAKALEAAASATGPRVAAAGHKVIDAFATTGVAIVKRKFNL